NGLSFRTIWNLQHARLGFDVANLPYFTAMPADASGFGNMEVAQTNQPAAPSLATTVYQPLLDRMRHSPGIQDAALMTAPPFSGIDLGSSFDVIGRPKEQGRSPQTRVAAVSGGYANLMGTPVLQGRMVSED